jgi:hypothetical protein
MPEPESKTKKKEPENKKAVAKPDDYNPRWKGYSYIALSSLINFATISNIDKDTDVESLWGVSLSFGIVLFVYSFVIVVTDRLQLGVEVFNYPKIWDGKLEGYSLLCLTAYSIVGVAYTTQVRGIAYLAFNVYFSSWLMMAACIYTLNKWSTAKDILSIQELTGVSATLKSWYIVALASMVVMGTSINMLITLGNYSQTLENAQTRAAALGIAFGFCSTVMSVFFILTHYNLIEWTTEGGWVELVCIMVAVLMWIVGTAVLTQDGGIAATIVGTGCQEAPGSEPALLTLIQETFQEAAQNNEEPDCEVIILNVSHHCQDLWDPPLSINDKAGQQENTIIPGSNLYLSVWTCLLASLNLASRWKAQQALQFAQARQEKAFVTVTNEGNDNKEAEGAGDGDDDLDEFDDADDD